MSAAAAGILDENQWVELKQAVPESGKSANLELARDLASLSVDGGLLIIGVEDAGGRAGEVVGTQLGGLATRVAQVATGRISPPLTVLTDVLENPHDAAVGLLVVSVPASESSPHMVDARYWGRGAEGKRPLSDSEVRRLMADHDAREKDFSRRVRQLPELLHGYDLEGPARLYLLAQPSATPRAEISDLISGQLMQQLVIDGLGFRPQWSPSFEHLSHNVPHPDGKAAATHRIDGTARVDDKFLFVLLGDNGDVRMSAPAARTWNSSQGEGPIVAVPAQMMETVHSAIRLGGHLAHRYSGYEGSWRIAVLGTKLRGLEPSNSYSHMGFQTYSKFPSEEYYEQSETTTAEMLEETPRVVERLLRRLLRAFSVDGLVPYNSAVEIPIRNQRT